MRVTTRSGRSEEVRFDAIKDRITEVQRLAGCEDVDVDLVVKKTIDALKDGITTQELDLISARIASNLIIVSPQYDDMARYITVDNIHRDTSPSLLDTYSGLADAGIVSAAFYALVVAHEPALSAMLDYSRDHLFDFFGITTAKKSYLLKDRAQNTVERPAHMYLRVALACHTDDLDSVQELYDALSTKRCTLASPALFNSGTCYEQLSSCFLLGMADSLTGIYETLTDCAQISKRAGGIGLSVGRIRGAGSAIRGTNGTSSGVMPLLKSLNATATHIDQGGNRKGSVAVYMEPWHTDIMAFLDARLPHGDDSIRARDLFYGLWVPDLFMRRAKERANWSLFCPDTCRDLTDLHGAAFDARYAEYEADPFIKRTVVSARDVVMKIISTQTQTGMPYMVFKDAVNSKNNQEYMGTITNSNLCAEICEYSGPDTVASCNLASISLPAHLVDGVFDETAFARTVRTLVTALDKNIGHNRFPVDKTVEVTLGSRPLGVGIQGLADAYAQLRVPFDSPAARELNKTVFRALYYHAVDTSIDLNGNQGPEPKGKWCPNHSPLVREGRLQPDAWAKADYGSVHDWAALRAKAMARGLRNSLLVAQMPTASTSALLGNTESVEPLNSNMYVRRTQSGEFYRVNKHMIQALTEMGLWDAALRDELERNAGSVQDIARIPEPVREVYKTCWEIGPGELIQQAADRGPFVCQSQSLNLFYKTPNVTQMVQSMFGAWDRGLKTGSYYTRLMPGASAQNFGLAAEAQGQGEGQGAGAQGGAPRLGVVCTELVCESCSG